MNKKKEAYISLYCRIHGSIYNKVQTMKEITEKEKKHKNQQVGMVVECNDDIFH